MSINTFKDLYEFLQQYRKDTIIDWLQIPWKGKDKQESLLRLFTGLGINEKWRDYTVCKGNFNRKTIQKHTCLKDVFYTNNRLINLKDKGDSSDMTGILKNNDTHIVVTTSKNINKITADKLEVDKILTNFKQYNNYTMSLCICIPNIDDFYVMKDRMERSSQELKKILDKDDTIVIDWEDLNQAYHQFKLIFNNIKVKDILNSNKPILCLKMHQQYAVQKTLQLKLSRTKTLWGHIPRSGKSYIMGGCIIQDSQNKVKSNYLVITTAPNETIQQQQKVFDCFQLRHFNVVVLNGKNKKPPLTDKNIIICSKQFLQTKANKPRQISWLKNINFDMRFIDESHNGGSTILAQKILQYYAQNAFTVHLTATYSKTVYGYDIPLNDWILWDLEDVKLCQKLTDTNLKKLVQKHGPEIKDVIHKYSLKNIEKEYSKYPELCILTSEIKPKVVTQIMEETRDNCYGWSTDSCFLLKQGYNDGKIITLPEFQNETEILKLWYTIFGNRNAKNIPFVNYPDDKVFIKRIERICKNPVYNSRFIGENDFRYKPMIILAFLPCKHINKLSKATVRLLERHNLIPDYDIICINSKITNNPKLFIENARIKAKNSGKKGVLVLCGKQCSLGISILDCDIILLLNNLQSFDMIYQMMFRSMTEGKGKKCGFVVDLNIHRAINTAITYASYIKPSEHPKDSIKYILQERLINLNGDQWMPTFGHKKHKIYKISDDIYELYSSNVKQALAHFLERLAFKKVDITKEEQQFLNTMFKPSATQKNKIPLPDTVKKGIEYILVEEDKPETKSKEKDEVIHLDYMDILKHIIPLISILSIHNSSTCLTGMYEYIKTDPILHNIFINQVKNWWGDMDPIVMDKFILLYKKYTINDNEIIQLIRTVKELFIKSIDKPQQLSELINIYLVPKELERKNNAEITTPLVLRQEIIEKIPTIIWNHKRVVNKRKTKVKYRLPIIFEPCAGKGGFLVDIVEKLMISLSTVVPDKNERYKRIVEECIYFGDINPTNIFICKLLLDPYNKYSLNYYEGNTLKLDTQRCWGISQFDLIIGNPPYNAPGSIGTGNAYWAKFTKQALNKWLRKKGILAFIHPPNWRKPCNDKSQLKGLFQLMCHDHQMLYLSMHDVKDGHSTFKSGTKYDWYIVKKVNAYTYTDVRDRKGEIYKIDLTQLHWLCNYDIDVVLNLVSLDFSNNLQVIMTSAYHANPKYKFAQNEKTKEYKYPLIHSTPKNGIKYKYTNLNNKGHFGVSKVIFGEGGINHVILDMKGKYGMTQGAMALVIQTKEEGERLKKALLSKKFDAIIQACIWGNFRIESALFSYIRKDFWKDML